MISLGSADIGTINRVLARTTVWESSVDLEIVNLGRTTCMVRSGPRFLYSVRVAPMSALDCCEHSENHLVLHRVLSHIEISEHWVDQPLRVGALMLRQQSSFLFLRKDLKCQTDAAQRSYFRCATKPGGGYNLDVEPSGV